MKRLMIITAVFALLLTGCGTRVSHDTLIELSVSSITEYQNRLNAIHSKDLQVSINELAQKEGLETRVATSEYSGKEYQYSRTYLDDGTEYSISATDHGDFFWVLITIVNSQDNTIPRKMCERIRSLAFERGLTLSRNKLSDKIVGGDLLNTSSRSVEIFAEILNAITSCENENELRACMKLIQERFPVSFNSCFIYGFGSTHMWVTEPGRKERLIFVEFD